MRRAETMHTLLIWDATRRVAEIAACLLVSMFMLEKLYILTIPRLLYYYSTTAHLSSSRRYLGVIKIAGPSFSVEDRNVVLGGDRAKPKRRKERIQRT